MNKQLASVIISLLLYPTLAVSAQTSEKLNNHSQANFDKTAVKAKQEKIEKKLEAITGAFGITLGKKFEDSMVTKILGEEIKSYKGADGKRLKGKSYQVEPKQQDERFQSYSVNTTDNGIIYEILGKYQYKIEKAKGKMAGKVKMQRTLRKTCKNAVKTLAKELETKHGKPRGQGYDGEWFSFSQNSETSDKRLRLYANRCRTGLYTIVYVDNKTKKNSRP